MYYLQEINKFRFSYKKSVNYYKIRKYFFRPKNTNNLYYFVKINFEEKLWHPVMIHKINFGE